MKLPRKFYSKNTKIVARELLGKILVHKKCKGRIVETEAYFGKNDPASRAYMGRPKFCVKLMNDKPGKALIYMVHNNWLFNIVAHEKNETGAVLIRALEPLEGIEIMKKRRGINDIKNLTNGPGKLTKAFGIDKRHNGLDLTKDNLFIENSNEKFEIVNTTRIGISRGKERLLRFYIKDNEFVSKK